MPIREVEGKKLKRDYPPEIIEFAKGLYMRNLSNSEIARKVRETFGCRATDVTIGRWARDEKWNEERGEACLATVQKFVDETSYDIAERTRDQIEAYRTMVRKGMETLEDENKEVKSPVTAASMVDLGIRGERQIIMGVIAVMFIGQIIDIIDEEIKDQQVREKVARKLREVAAEWQDKGM